MRIKKVTPYLKPGDTIRGWVRECLDNGHLIVNFEGDLLNVVNRTRQSFREGDVIALHVDAVRPLTFRVLSEATSPQKKSWKI